MSFNIIEFTRTNRVFFIWVAFGALLYLFRDMFGLVFITYIMCFVAHSATTLLRNLTGMNRRLAVVLCYLAFVAVLTVLLFFLVPRLISETKNFTDQLPRAMRIIDAWVESSAAENPDLIPIVQHAREAISPEQLVIRGWAVVKGLVEGSVHYGSWFLLGLLFSFLIMLDLPHLMRSARNLRFTRLAAVYNETTASVVLFAKVVGENFRAQLMVSALNTVLTVILLNVLGINGAALLCTLVFLCGLIPVLGVFISSVPIVLMAVNTGGIKLGLWAVLMIIVIHLIEAYVLNPRIVSAVMRINPVMTLIILYIAHSLIGIWGMLLGVPIAVYIYRQITAGLSSPPSEPQKTEVRE